MSILREEKFGEKRIREEEKRKPFVLINWVPIVTTISCGWQERFVGT